MIRLAFLLSLCALPLQALTLADCTRVTHISHGGEAGHRDMGAGHVFWTQWWSQEGVFTEVWLADCRAGRVLSARVAEDRISERPGFDRTALAMAVIDRHDRASDAFLKLETVAHDLRNIAEDINIAALEADPCACAATYPDLRNGRTAFEMSQ